jgi:hypothetical protein
MKKQKNSASGILGGLFILFSAVALGLFTLHRMGAGDADLLEAIPTFGFCGVLVLAAFAKMTGSVRFLQLFLFFIGFGLFGLGGLITSEWSLPGVFEVMKTEKWQQISCRIATSEVERIRSPDGGVVRRPIIRYTYEVGGEHYASDVVDVFWTPISGGMNAEKVVDVYPVDTETTCWMNPDNPQEVSLQRGWQPMHFAALLPLLLVVPGLVIMVAALWRRRSPSP